MRIALKALGVLLSALGLGMSLFAVLALIDPEGSQHSNDADPFGTPPATEETLVRLACGLFALGFGWWLYTRRRRQQ